MTPRDLKAWQRRMGFTQEQASDALGVYRSTFCALLLEKSRNTGKPLKIDRRTELACAALEAGITALKKADD